MHNDDCDVDDDTEKNRNVSVFQDNHCDGCGEIDDMTNIS